MKYIFSLIVLALLVAPPARAEKPLPDVAAVESYLNGLTSVSARFVQTANDGTETTGLFLLKRPGRMRFEYDPPVKDFIVADGTLVYYYDGQMKQQSSLPIGRSLGNFFLRKDLSLSGDIRVEDIDRQDGVVQVSVVQSKNPYAGSITLFFAEAPLTLKGWQVVDAQGLTTRIQLDRIDTVADLKSDLFKYYDPEKKRPLINK